MVKRYDIADDDDSGDVSMMEFEDGEYVTFAEYDALAARLAETEAALLDKIAEQGARLAEEVASHDNTRTLQTAAQVKVLMLQERLADLQENADLKDVHWQQVCTAFGFVGHADPEELIEKAARLAEAEHLILRMAGEDYQRARFYVEKYDLTGERAAVSASGGA